MLELYQPFVEELWMTPSEIGEAAWAEAGWGSGLRRTALSPQWNRAGQSPGSIFFHRHPYPGMV